MSTPELMKKFSEEAYNMGRLHAFELMATFIKNKMSRINNGRTPTTAHRKSVRASSQKNSQKKSPNK